MTQGSLLDWSPPVAAPAASEQGRQIVRVESRLAQAIIRWAREHVGQEFHLAAMTTAVTGHHQAAPDSVRRIASALTRAGHVEIVCVDRSRSLWKVVRA